MKKIMFTFLLFASVLFSTNLKAGNYVAADLNYTYIGTNQYLIYFICYVECDTINEPNFKLIHFNCSSDSTLSFTDTLFSIPGTGQEVSLDCGCSVSTCKGGTAFGVREYAYTRQIYLTPCDFWTISINDGFRNSVSTVLNGDSNSFYIETTLYSQTAMYNSSPSFSDTPIKYVYNGYSYCYNHGSIDSDGDSLVYYFSSPKINSNDTVNFSSPWSNSNFLTASNITLNSVTGEICFTPSANLSTITGIKVEEWRKINGIPTLIGTTQRDFQFHVKTYYNETPILSGIDTTNSHTYNPNDTIHYMEWAYGDTIDFDINAYDADTAKPNCNCHPDEYSISWNNGISDASFVTSDNSSDSAYAHFHWVPTYNDVISSPHCFSVMVHDYACPFFGESISEYCITISSGVGIESNEVQKKISIYPNPSSGIFYIDFSTESNLDCSINVYNVLGKEVYKEEWMLFNNDIKYKLDLSQLRYGVYFIKISQGSQEMKTTVIIK